MKSSNCAIFALSLCFSATSLADYFIVVDGKQQGPYSLERLQAMKANGSFNAATPVWQEGMAGWVSAESRMDLQNIIVATQAPPPLPVTGSQPPPLSIPPQIDRPLLTSDKVEQADINEHNAMSNANAIVSASDSIDDWADEAVSNFGREKGEFGEKDGKIIIYGSQTVSLKPTDPQFGSAMINAFDRALMKVQEEYVTLRFGRTITEKSRSFYSDQSTNAKELELPESGTSDVLNKVLLIFDKSLDVAGKKLDQELLEMGVDPGTLQTMTPKVKKDLFRDKFVKRTIRNASGSIAGLFTLQTAVITDKKGRTSVGVLGIVSDKTIQIAKDITLQRESLISGKGRQVSTLIPSREKDFTHTLGTRLLYDELGAPAIVSYGISSYSPSSADDYINDQLKSEAREAAISNADAQIAELLNGYMSVEIERERGEEISQVVEREVKADSDTVEKTIKNIISITNNKAKTSAKAKLQGISTVKTWRYTASTGQKFVGAVRVWKYSTLNAIQSFNQVKKPKAEQATSEHNVSHGASRPVNSSADF
ncbi:hypothetical protein OLMES_5163 [Oleiphilus messinensis]|uniref:Uncharacterized protein n=1 Tax=Oleiphilus messinensis TaxID=141451 RepID=A0A1Y0IF30_9GAMM|nr:DUF4339 domain-containing protein [Oleiphilus messinensis]ARU59147.1 hypothetical protein OLMES_5163 [Oleiphilus messinensis]